MSTFLSIITINFNNASGLEKTIKSVICQTFKDFEFIIIDGASTDSSLDIIESFKNSLNILISEEDSGIYDAMNKGINQASGEYLLFLNSGDALTNPSALDEFINHKKFTGDIIYGDYLFENGHKIYPDILPPEYFMKTSLPHQSTFFKKTVFDTIGLYDESYKMGADRAFFIKCFESKEVKFKHINYFLTLFDLAGMSNAPEYLSKKKKEDEQMLFEFYGSKYDDYKEKMALEKQKKERERKSPKGILKRIIKRIKKK